MSSESSPGYIPNVIGDGVQMIWGRSGCANDLATTDTCGCTHEQFLRNLSYWW